MTSMQTGMHYPIDLEALPAGWEKGYVGDFALEIKPGFASGEHNKEGRGIPHIRPYNIDRSGKLDLSEIKSVDPEADTKRLHSGDVLFNNTNSPELIGKTTVITAADDWGFSNHMTRVAFPDAVSPKFAAYQLHYLWSRGYFLHNCVKHVNQASVSSTTLARAVPFIKPPRFQQDSIVAEIEKQFSRLDEAVANLKRVKANLKRYKASVLKAAVEGCLVPTEAELSRQAGRSYEMAAQLLKANEQVSAPKLQRRRAGRLWGAGHVPQLTPDELSKLPEGWAWAKVRQLGADPEDAVQVGPMSMKSEDFKEAGVPVLNVGCVQWGRFDETKLNFLPESIAENFSRYRIQPGDVLFTRSGTVGRCTVAKAHQRNWLMTFHLLRARPNPNCCLPEYLRTVFEGAAHIRRQTREASIGTTRAGFNTNLLANLDIPLPPMAEQQRIVAEVERRLSIIEELEAVVEANLTRADRLRQSILSQAFSGALSC